MVLGGDFLFGERISENMQLVYKGGHGGVRCILQSASFPVMLLHNIKFCPDSAALSLNRSQGELEAFTATFVSFRWYFA